LVLTDIQRAEAKRYCR